MTSLVLSTTHKNKPVFESFAPLEQDNVFLHAAESLFVVGGRVKNISSEMDPLALQNYLIPKIHHMEILLQQNNIRAEKILLAKYFMCCFLDDLIEHDWQSHQGLWRGYRLVFYFFQERSGDERFLALLDRLQQEPSSNIALLELVYMIFLYGYQGSYRALAQGYYLSLQKIDELYHLLHWQYGDFRKNLFISFEP